MESKFRVDGDGLWFATTDLAWRMNEYDEYAVEQAVRVKEQLGEGDITVLCIGGDQVKETMKKALAMGCDRGAHIQDQAVSAKEPFQIAGVIAEYARDKNFDLLFTGMQSQDRGSAQVGLLVAEMLGMPGVSTVVDFQLEGNRVEVRRELEGGTRAKLRLSLPALVTCQLGLNTPRYPTLPNIMKAKKKELLSLPVEDFLKVEARQQTESMFLPEKKKGGLILEGDPAELVDQLVAVLKEKTGVLS
jgi:electron transfer flavoprotein beta subunit